jgi:hypothetical protein
MEDMPRNPDDTTPETETNSYKWRKRQQKLQHWLSQGPGLFRFGARPGPEGHSEDEEDEPTPEVKLGRLQRFLEKFRRPFGGHIAQPEFVQVPEAATSETVVELTAEVAATEDRELTDEIDSELAPTEPTPSASATPEAATPPPEIPPPIVVPGREASTPSPAHIAAAEYVVAPFRITEAATRPPVERIVESPRASGALGVLLGLEYFGRKRADRKIRRELKNKLAAQQKVQRGEAKAVERRVQSTTKEVQTVQNRQRTHETQLVAVENRPPTIERSERPAAELRPPVIWAETQPKEAVPEKLPLAEQVIYQIETLKQPEAVLARVENAADQNIPVEAVYERRHEVKDQPPFEGGGGSGGPSQAQTPILLANALKDRLASVQAASAAAHSEQSSVKSPDLYKQAVKRGLWGATVLLIFIAILFVIGSH